MTIPPRPIEAHSRGAALLLVIGATAALGTLATLLLSFSLLAYESAALRVDGTQARLLAQAGILEVGMALEDGRLPVPAVELVWQGRVPPAPPGFDSLPVAGEPQLPGVPGGGCGFRVFLMRVLRPTGEPQVVIVDGALEPAALVDARAEGWCGRGAAEVEARFAVVGGKIAVRLH